MSDRRLRLTIVGGFLGSGKTTWLRHQLFEGRFAGAHIIVNEAAGTPVDDAFLGTDDSVTVLADGCACCEGAARFQATLVALCDQRSQGEGPEAIVLETSGLADPGAIIALIQAHPILVRQIVVADVCVVVDALHARVQLEEFTLARAQIDVADHLIVTKTDAADPDHSARVLKTLAMLAPSARVSLATFGSARATPDIPLGTRPYQLGDSGTINAVTPVQLDLGDSPDWTALTLWLSALLHARGATLIRTKGVIETPAGRLLLQAVRNQVQSPEILPPSATRRPTDNILILIGQDLSQDQLARSFAALS
ncbi:MAG: GTP-binding protein [Pseudomonadota bacterium]